MDVNEMYFQIQDVDGDTLTVDPDNSNPDRVTVTAILSTDETAISVYVDRDDVNALIETLTLWRDGEVFDTASSASRQHFIETGRYLTESELAGQPRGLKVTRQGRSLTVTAHDIIRDGLPTLEDARQAARRTGQVSPTERLHLVSLLAAQGRFFFDVVPLEGHTEDPFTVVGEAVATELPSGEVTVRPTPRRAVCMANVEVKTAGWRAPTIEEAERFIAGEEVEGMAYLQAVGYAVEEGHDGDEREAHYIDGMGDVWAYNPVRDCWEPIVVGGVVYDLWGLDVPAVPAFVGPQGWKNIRA